MFNCLCLHDVQLNRFQALADTTEDDNPVNTKWDVINNTYVDAATKILGYKKKYNKKWITPGTWQKIEERKQLKAKLLSTKSSRLQEQVQKTYTRTKRSKGVPGRTSGLL